MLISNLLHLVLMSKIVELHIYVPICLHGMVLNYIKDKCNTLKTWKSEDWLHSNLTTALGRGVRFMIQLMSSGV
jgi:hypothetical protein